MKREVNKGVFFAIIGVVVVVAGFLLWFYTQSPWDRPGGAAAIFNEHVKWAKAHNIDLRKDGLAGPVYYHFHPEETPKNYDPFGVKAANARALAARAAKAATQPGAAAPGTLGMHAAGPPPGALPQQNAQPGKEPK